MMTGQFGLWPLIIVMGAYILWLTWMYRRLEGKRKEVLKTSSRLIHGLHMDLNELRQKDSVQAYEALEQGMDEQQESYEQEYLSWQEKEFDYMWTLAHVMNRVHDLELDVEDLVQLIHERNVEINELYAAEEGRKNNL